MRGLLHNHQGAFDVTTVSPYNMAHQTRGCDCAVYMWLYALMLAAGTSRSDVVRIDWLKANKPVVNELIRPRLQLLMGGLQAGAQASRPPRRIAKARRAARAATAAATAAAALAATRALPATQKDS